jgi:hypothetical protein
MSVTALKLTEATNVGREKEIRMNTWVKMLEERNKIKLHA